MQFTTQIPILPGNQPIDYNSRVVCLGSCFAVNIGQKFDYFKFRNITNPFGILFSPAALEKFIGFAVNQKEFTEADIFFHNERWHCFDAHSELSHPDKETLLANLTTATAETNEALQHATHLIITLGTAWVYRHIGTGALVANCHKVPQKEFTKELLPVVSIKQSLLNIVTLIADINPEAHVTFTISPVRHIKDGFIENQRSKANLIAALHELLLTVNCQLSSDYFPSYEIMMDELRDYRFYAEDMIHPNQVAIDYIWERFTEACIAPGAHHTMQQVDSVQKGLRHRPFNAHSAAYEAFRADLEHKMAALQRRFPHICF
ncbi:GSCFA domain-containing protein [Flavobacterium cyanobacteriorum]|uniref:GSCFA domain-containing protein n=1 Tax=Flavobacterium cyanobacteriorum TaxID=2022802 RepID=A0A255ZBB0_9FLAO|nr:GSCFA domain-containing protein [Flavobacterium cyanobacteriorum]OYQ38155.1 GSCFA domain-containing protein [Flavobacterium cyanobacteriorum]